MTGKLNPSEGLLILPHLRVQNANAISSPLTHGFPSMTAFLGLMWALERKLGKAVPRLYFNGVGVICHGYEEQVGGDGHIQRFRLTRNPINHDGSTAAIVEEGRMHLDITLVFGVSGADDDNIVHADDVRRAAHALHVGEVLAGMRVAGGSVLPSQPARGRRIRPELIALVDRSDEPEAHRRQARRLCRQWLPGFALVARDDLLQARIAAQRESDPDALELDAWLHLSRFNWRSRVDEAEKVIWEHDRSEGWVVPIPVGYGALSDPLPPGSVRSARDPEVPFRFVESLYSIGQWVGPHRLMHPEQLLWYVDNDPDAGLYRCRNDYATDVANAHH